jgi:translation initiation factor IF-1
MTPYKALYGRPPPSLPEYFDGATPVHEVEQTLLYRDELLLQLKHHLATTTNRMKQTADKKQRDVSFQEGDIVFLKLQPYRQSSTFKRVHQKLASRFFGLYPIL